MRRTGLFHALARTVLESGAPQIVFSGGYRKSRIPVPNRLGGEFRPKPFPYSLCYLRTVVAGWIRYAVLKKPSHPVPTLRDPRTNFGRIWEDSGDGTLDAISAEFRGIAPDLLGWRPVRRRNVSDKTFLVRGPSMLQGPQFSREFGHPPC